MLIAFAGLGLGSFVPSLQFNRDYISAGKTSIGIQEIANQFNKLRAEVAPNLTINEAIQNGYLDLLITFLSNEAILLEEANTWGIKVTRDQLKKSLLENKLFLDENGKFSSSKFQTSLLRGGVSEENYLELLGRNLIKQQLTETVSESAKISNEVIQICVCPVTCGKFLCLSLLRILYSSVSVISGHDFLFLYFSNSG